MRAMRIQVVHHDQAVVRLHNSPAVHQGQRAAVLPLQHLVRRVGVRLENLRLLGDPYARPRVLHPHANQTRLVAGRQCDCRAPRRKLDRIDQQAFRHPLHLDSVAIRLEIRLRHIQVQLDFLARGLRPRDPRRQPQHRPQLHRRARQRFRFIEPARLGRRRSLLLHEWPHVLNFPAQVYPSPVGRHAHLVWRAVIRRRRLGQLPGGRLRHYFEGEPILAGVEQFRQMRRKQEGSLWCCRIHGCGAGAVACGYVGHYRLSREECPSG